MKEPVPQLALAAGGVICVAEAGLALFTLVDSGAGGLSNEQHKARAGVLTVAVVKLLVAYGCYRGVVALQGK